MPVTDKTNYYQTTHAVTGQTRRFPTWPLSSICFGFREQTTKHQKVLYMLPEGQCSQDAYFGDLITA